MIFVMCGVFGYYYKTLFTLSGYGLDGSIKILPSSQIEQIKQYRKICVENRLPIFWANFMSIYPYMGIVLIVGWVLLLTLSI